jgi:hypothetical protein
MSVEEFPEYVEVPSGRGKVRFVRAPGLFAVHGSQRSRLTLPVEFEIEDPPVAVYRGDPGATELAQSDAVTPVYASGVDRGVPTGLVFVRFRKGVDPRKKADDLAQTGFRVREIPGYAPNAAWVEAVSGRAGEALRDLDKLRALTGVVSVEPQLIRPVSRR